MRPTTYVAGFLALTVALCLGFVGCSFNTQDAVVLGLDAVEGAMSVAVSANPGPAAVAVLTALSTAVPTCIQVYESNEPVAQKVGDMLAALGGAVANAGVLGAKDSSILKATLAAVQVVLKELQTLQPAATAHAATAHGVTAWEGLQVGKAKGDVQIRTSPLNDRERGYLLSIAKKNNDLAVRLKALQK